jgi:hypothetical protein
MLHKVKFLSAESLIIICRTKIHHVVSELGNQDPSRDLLSCEAVIFCYTSPSFSEDLVAFSLKMEATRSSENVGILTQQYKASKRRRRRLKFSLPWKSQISRRNSELCTGGSLHLLAKPKTGGRRQNNVS